MIIFLISHKNICCDPSEPSQPDSYNDGSQNNENIYCDPSLELPQRDSYNDGSQNMFSWKNMDNYPKFIPVTPS